MIKEYLTYALGLTFTIFCGYIAIAVYAATTQDIVMGGAVPDNYMCIKDSVPDSYLCYPEYDVPWYHTDPRQ